MEERKTRLIYENPLSKQSDIKDFILEGRAVISFPEGRMRMQNGLPEELDQQANFVFWCPKIFPESIRVTWDFWAIEEPGLCIMFFCAEGCGGEGLFSPKLQKRTGPYSQYNSGDINAYHIAYFRRKYIEEYSFQTCNLRKSKGFHLVAQGGDPLPSVAQSVPPYHMTLEKDRNIIRFYINGLLILTYEDDGEAYGPVLGNGCIGFRQMAPLVAEYSNFRVYELY